MRLRLWKTWSKLGDGFELQRCSQQVHGLIQLSGRAAFSKPSQDVGLRFHSNGFIRTSNLSQSLKPTFPQSLRPLVSRKFHVLSLAATEGKQTSDVAGMQPKLNARTFHPGSSDDSFIFRQLVDYKSYTYTYLLADATSKEAVLIDPVIDTVERDYRVVKDLGLKLLYGANTHVHADHVTGTGELKRRLPECKSMIAKVSKAQADVKLKAGDTIKFGRFELEVRSTPGHTNGCLSYVWHEKGMVFTGDALLIRGCGRTDFQEGSAEVLYDSVHNQIFTLPHHFKVFPAHDYTGQTMSTVGEEVHFNPRLKGPKSKFITVMNNLNLPYPKQIDKALPANMVCGIYDVE